MMLEGTFHQLCTQLLALHEACANLRTTVREDKPLQDDAVLVDLFGDAADDLLGWLDEALVVATDGQRSAGYPLDLSRARQALATCQERYQEITRRYWGDICSYERLRELRRFGRRRGGEWLAWASSVRASLDACQESLWAIDRELFCCWLALVASCSGEAWRASLTHVVKEQGTARNLVKEA